MSKIILNNVKKHYIWGEERIDVLKGISLSLEEKTFTCIIGESGSGKTTLLNLMGGLDNPDSGSIIFNGQEISSFKDHEISLLRNKNMGFIFQSYNLLQDFTVLENVMLPYYIYSHQQKEALEKAREILYQLGLEHRISYYPSRLSGGEQQRVAIARALINKPDILFADEPTGSLDKENREKVMEMLLTLKKEYLFTLIMVTHDPQIAKLADKKVYLNYGVIEKIL